MSEAGERDALLLPSVSLWRREVVRFLRQRSRVIGALGTPLIFWILIGSGLRRSFQLPETTDGGDYLEYSFPGIMGLIVLFTAIFSMISIIEDRREGFMQAVLAAPVRRSAIVLGKVLGSSTLALLQAMLFLLLAPLASVPLSVSTALATFGVLIVVSLGLSGLGFLIAWPMSSTQGFHAIMNLLLMPMWLLSGAFFPAEGASAWVRWIMAINPLTYGVAAVRQALYLGADPSHPTAVSPWVAIGVTIVFSVAMILLSAKIVDKNL